MKHLKWLLLGTLALFCILLVWGVVIEPRLISEQAYTVRIPGLPGSWEGKRVALIADIQEGMWLNNSGTTRRIVRRIVELNPALVLLAGDFVYEPTDDEAEDVEEEFLEGDYREDVEGELATLARLLRPIGALPAYAVLGNHDFGMQTPESIELPWLAPQVTKALAEIGIVVLNNQAVPLRDPGTRSEQFPLYLVGIGARYPNEDLPLQAVSNVPVEAPRLVFMHNPQSFAGLPPHSAPLAMAGHTHGGQIRLPFLPDWSYLTFLKDEEVHADGWIDGFGQPGNRLYVNRGIGFSLVPIRINCRPELTVFTLCERTCSPDRQ